MTTIEDQIKLEQQMVGYGLSRYRRSVDNANEKGRGADNKYAQVLLREFIDPVSKAIDDYCSGRVPAKNAKYRVLLRQVDSEKAAYFGLRSLLNHFTSNPSLANLGNSIGTMIEDEIKFTKFRNEHPNYFDEIIADLKRKGTKNYRHIHRVLTFKANEKEMKWNSWSTEERVAVGIKVVDLILQSTDLAEKSVHYERGKTVVSIVPSEESKDWIKRFHAYAELLHPDKLPCIIQPEDWTGIHDGGYYTPDMRKKTPLVKTRSKEHADMFLEDIDNITKAVNAIQRTAWSVNKPVYDVLHTVWSQNLGTGLPRSIPYEIPASPVAHKKKEQFSEKDKENWAMWKDEARTLHSLERERVSKCFQVMRVIKLGRTYQNYDKFWFVYQCDFRGRVYASVPGFSPQGTDFAKGILQFAEGKVLGERGLYWLQVHGANCYGVDKVSYEDRIKWVEAHKDIIVQSARDPIPNREFWANADAPYQFLAFCMEYERYTREGIGMLSYIPIGLDGSCNGLQNFSAMLRDPVGGAETNLVPGDKPADIYSRVAEVCSNKLKEMSIPDDESAEVHRMWMDVVVKLGGLPRSLPKRPVMTLPYGSTQQSCREYIYQWIVEEGEEYIDKSVRFKASAYLTPILWSSINEVVVSARVAMDWIQKCASILAKKDAPIMWWTPIGFPVYQDRKVVKVRRVPTQLLGDFRIRVGSAGDKMDVLKNKLASSPNFVHSMDACHLMMTCHKALSKGITSFAFIHDDYGTHAADTDLMHEALREAFLELYAENDPLTDFKIFNEDRSGVTLPDPPRKGILNLTHVLESKYFFG